MVDLLPLFIFGTGVLIASWITIARSGRTRGSMRMWLFVLLNGSLVVAAPYLAFVAVHGDPDVWDFYRSMWWVPVVVFLALCTYVAHLAHRRGVAATAAQ